MASSSQPNQPGSASSSQPNPTGSASSQTNQTGSSSSQTNRSERARQVWDDITEFLLADDSHLDMFKCGLCDDIMVDVTVVTKCQHGFCAGCIQEYVFEDGIHECPRCPTDLGDNPSEYLWHDELTTDLIEHVVEYHEHRRLLEEPAAAEPNTEPPAPEPSTMPPAPEPSTMPPAPEPNTTPPAPEPSIQDSDSANEGSRA